MKSKVFFVLSVALSLVAVLWIRDMAAAGSSDAFSAPVISNLQIVTTNVARYERFEAQFDVQTVAANPNLPYDPYPPPGVEAEIGVTVNAEFSSDGWATKQVQPAFYNQPYNSSTHNSRDHLTPDGAPNWVVRFAPQVAGEWQFRLCVTDTFGTTYYPDLGSPALTFSVAPTSTNPYTSHGFLQASQTDRRYFEFSDGTPFVGVGFNDTFTATAVLDAKMDAYEQNKMNFMRVWLSTAGINGSHWTSWATNFIPYDGNVPGVHFNTEEENTYNGADFSMVLDNSNPCFFSEFHQNAIPVEPNTTYGVSARVKLVGVTGPSDPAGEYGFVVKQAGWLDQACDEPNNGALITTPVISSTGWITVTGSYTTSSSQYWLNYLYLTRQNAITGTVYIDEVRLWRADDPSQIDILREPNANSHEYFDPMNAAQWDRFIQLAEEHGVYLKLVIDEKNEWLRNHLDASGESVPDGSNNNFYAAPGTKVRWLQEAWWRYIIARWGYSTAVHSFEYINEGNPGSTSLYEAANSMARYFDENDPSRHMVTTSFWGDFPNVGFWSNPSYQNIDYADIHTYITTGWGWNASFLPPEFIETDPAHIHSGNASVHITATVKVDIPIAPRGMALQQKGEWIVRYWMEANDFSTDCSTYPQFSGGMQRVRWLLDGGKPSGREGIIPTHQTGIDFNVCLSPGGTYGWTQFSSDRDRYEIPISSSFRISITDTLPHTLTLRLENFNGTGGMAWIDDVELVSPDGRVQPVIGEFDITPMDEDTAWYNYAYACVWGANNLVGVHKPLVRGEVGITLRDQQIFNPDLLLDTEGIWLHNNVWGQSNACGMADLFWWAKETIPESIYDNYWTFRNFMEDIPLNNGNYKDISTEVSDESLRAWGQQDDTHGRIHLWIQNKQHTWTAVVHGTPITPVVGTVALLNVPAGNYDVQWWNTYTVSNPVFLEEALVSNGVLTLTLPYPLMDDVAVKIAINPPPSVDAGADQVALVGDAVNLLATFTDLSPNDTHTASIDWGDGMPDAGIVDEETGNVSGSHVYTGAGAFIVTVSVTDDNGGTGSDTASIEMRNLFADGFEGGNFSAWRGNNIIDGGRLSVSAAAALNGSSYGMQAFLNGTTKPIYVTDTSPNAEKRYRARFYFDPNGMSMNGTYPYILYAQQSNGTIVVAINLTFSGGKYKVRLVANNDSGGSGTSWYELTDGPHCLEFDWQAASSPDIHDGHLTFWLDGVQYGPVTEMDNDGRRVDTLRLGAVGSLNSSMNGTWYFDDFVSRKGGDYIGPVSLPPSASSGQWFRIDLASTVQKLIARLLGG